MNFAAGFLLGAFLGAACAVFALFAAIRKIASANLSSVSELPLDAMLTFALFDDEGNQLTERSPVFIDGAGSNSREVSARVVRSGRIHHGVVFVGDYGVVIEAGGDMDAKAGSIWAVPPGNWTMELTPAEHDDGERRPPGPPS